MKKIAEVIMVKTVAISWLESRLMEEYRLRVFGGQERIRKLPDLLKSFRDGKLRLGDVEPITDLGIEVGFDYINLWSSNEEGLKKLSNWFESKGLEVYGV